MKNKLLVCPFLVLFVLLGCVMQTPNTTKNPKQEVGENVQTLHYETNYVESTQYPKLNIEAIDKCIEGRIKRYKKSFYKRVSGFHENEKAEFNVTYESYLKDDRYISIVLQIYENMYEKKEYIETVVYDTQKEIFLTFDDVYDKDELITLCNQAKLYFQERFPKECDSDQFRTHISSIIGNFQLFVLTKNKLIIYFPAGTLFENQATYSIGYEDISNATSLKNEATPAIVPYEDILNEPMKYIDETKPMIALTFDDGPTRRYTTAILDALKEHDAYATFFILGSRAGNAPDLLQRMVLEGSEIGNHSYSHKQLTTLSKERVEEELSATQESIYGITKRYPEIIRPPYGSKNDMIMQCAQGKKVVTWTLDTRDWSTKDAKKTVTYVMDHVKDGDIILMHDLYASTAQAATILIPKLKEAGYQLVTVSDLYQYRPLTK